MRKVLLLLVLLTLVPTACKKKVPAVAPPPPVAAPVETTPVQAEPLPSDPVPTPNPDCEILEGLLNADRIDEAIQTFESGSCEMGADADDPALMWGLVMAYIRSGSDATSLRKARVLLEGWSSPESASGELLSVAVAVAVAMLDRLEQETEEGLRKQVVIQRLTTELEKLKAIILEQKPSKPPGS